MGYFHLVFLLKLFGWFIFGKKRLAKELLGRVKKQMVRVGGGDIICILQSYCLAFVLELWFWKQSNLISFTLNGVDSQRENIQGLVDIVIVELEINNEQNHFFPIISLWVIIFFLLVDFKIQIFPANLFVEIILLITNYFTIKNIAWQTNYWVDQIR